jgi:hypothetical protein
MCVWVWGGGGQWVRGGEKAGCMRRCCFISCAFEGAVCGGGGGGVGGMGGPAPPGVGQGGGGYGGPSPPRGWPGGGGGMGPPQCG